MSARPAEAPDRLRGWEPLAAAATALLVGWRLAFTNLILARGDTFLYFYPLWDYRAQALRAGRLPLWAPEIFMGAPFLANSQTGVLYPLNWPLLFLAAPIAVKVTILIHLMLAAVGAQQLARRRLGFSAGAALLSAALFAAGGYLAAQVEHINQLQALAWFPWLLLALGITHRWRRLCVAAVVIALQVLAGHTQSVFICLAGAALYAALPPTEGAFGSFNGRAALGSVAGLLLAAVAAAALAGAQLLPTLELSRESLRSGGLPWREAVSFSLDPRLLGRALLPGYSRGLFTEYVGYLGTAGLALAVSGINRSRRSLSLWLLTLAGLALALGAYDPAYAALAAFPPFNLFRVPARWLFLAAFGGALLAGLGFDRWRTTLTENPRQRWRAWAIAAAAPLALGALTPLAARVVPPGETGPLGLPALADWVGWAWPLLAVTLCLLILKSRWQTYGVLTVVLVELGLAGLTLPLNHLTAPEAYNSVRPAMTQLLAQRAQPVADRFLSMSALQFDPGDLAELHSRLDAQLPPDAVYDYLVATKHKEVLSPNLPLTWGLPAVDGFDGGILPLRHYAAFTQLFTSGGQASADGRLRENITTAPAPRLLALVNARWLITDKVNDAWIDGVFYDQQLPLTLTAGQTSTVVPTPAFEATALGVVMEAPGGGVTVTAAEGVTLNLSLSGGRLEFGRPLTVTGLTLSGPLAVRGLSLIDARTGAFQSLTLGPYRLAHSGDVKVYENKTVLPRAFVVPQAEVIATDDAARARLADPNFDPAQAVIVAAPPPLTPPTGPPTPVNILRYMPEDVQLTAAGPGYLVLTDAFYPGWTATLDGQPVPLLRADIMFRALALPAGAHTIEFKFAPLSLSFGLALSGLGLVVLIAVTIFSRSQN